MNSHTITLQYGHSGRIRPLYQGDDERLIDMHRRISLASLTSRYFYPHTPSREELVDICHLSSDRGVAYVATVDTVFERNSGRILLSAMPPHRLTSHEAQCLGEAIIGLGYYIIDESQPTVAEPAFLVEDSFQGQGIGRALFQHLVRHALARNVQAFDAYVQPANKQMLHFLQCEGFMFKERLSYGTYEVYIELTGPAH